MSVYDVLDAARTKWNFLDFRPGLVGGHCIGIDPYYLAHCALEAGHNPEIVLAGRRINDAMGEYIAGRIAADLQRRRDGADFGVPRTLVLGLTFKEDLPDLRNSKVVDLVRGLEAHGHRVAVHDSRADPALAASLYGIELEPALWGNGADPYDCVVGAVAHQPYREFTADSFARLLKPGGMAADVKGMWRDTSLPPGIHRWQL
jgi:UDP-N-acetyl-D-galactosamine dehydrogenase